MSKPWTERPETGEIWHFGGKTKDCSDQHCSPMLVAVNDHLWLEYFRGHIIPTAVEPWDSLLMHWPDE